MDHEEGGKPPSSFITDDQRKEKMELLKSSGLWKSVVLILLGILMLFLLSRLAKRLENKKNVNGKVALNVNFTMAIIRYIVILLLVLVLLQINGVDVTALITGLGVAGIIVGFALQDILKDFIMGANLVWNDFFRAGDVIKCGELEGTVVSFNIRVTKLRDIYTDSIHTVSNRNLSEIEVVSRRLDMDVPAPYDVSAVRMRQICDVLCERVRGLENVNDCTFLGTQSFGSSQIDYRVRILCPPEQKPAVRRAVNGLIQDVFAEEGIGIPFNQLDVHLFPQEKK